MSCTQYSGSILYFCGDTHVRRLDELEMEGRKSSGGFAREGEMGG